jgi:hypothetical protein
MMDWGIEVGGLVADAAVEWGMSRTSGMDLWFSWFQGVEIIVREGAVFGMVEMTVIVRVW